jgi:hypothetical protein
MLALEARNRGKLTTAQVIARYEEGTRLDPAVHSDWARGDPVEDLKTLTRKFQIALDN